MAENTFQAPPEKEMPAKHAMAQGLRISRREGGKDQYCPSPKAMIQKRNPPNA
jgi:hypothetical protein